MSRWKPVLVIRVENFKMSTLKLRVRCGISPVKIGPVQKKINGVKRIMLTQMFRWSAKVSSLVYDCKSWYHGTRVANYSKPLECENRLICLETRTYLVLYFFCSVIFSSPLVQPCPCLSPCLTSIAPIIVTKPACCPENAIDLPMKGIERHLPWDQRYRMNTNTYRCIVSIYVFIHSFLHFRTLL